MAEDLNGYFSSVFTREDITSLPVPYAQFQDAESELLCSPNWCEHCEEQGGSQDRPGQLSPYATNTLDLAKTVGSIRTQ